MSEPFQIHATCIALDGYGVLLRGPSGIGKSDLAARTIVEANAQLVSDDITCLNAIDGHLMARAPATIANRIELRGVGILNLQARESVVVALVADLTRDPQRLPEPAYEVLLGIELPRVELNPHESGAIAKLRLALGAGGATILPPDR